MARGRGSRGCRKRKSPAEPRPDDVVDEVECLPCPEAAPQRGSSGRGRGSRSRMNGNPPSRPRTTYNVDLIDTDEEESPPSPEAVPQRRTSGRGRGSRSRMNRHPPPRPRPSYNADLSDTDEEECPPCPEAVPQCRTSGRGRSQRGRNARRPRHTVLSLDVTFSSEDFEDELGSNENTSSPEVTPKHPFSLSLSSSLLLNDSTIQSDSANAGHIDCTKQSDTDDERVVVKTAEVTVEKEFQDSDSDEDLFSIDYNSRRDMALKSAFKEISNLEKKEIAKIDRSDDCICIEGSPALSQDGESPQILSQDLNLSLPGSPIKLTNSRKIKRSKKITQAQKHLKKVFEEISKNQPNDSFSGEISILSSDDNVDEENENSSIMLLVKWESNYLHWPVRKYQKFSSVYQEVADRFSLNVGQVLLCHNDKVISPEVCPKDLNLNIGDIIEGGVQSQPTLKVKNTVATHSPDSIPLKVQSSDRKGTVTIYIRRHDKMIELMHRYAEEKNVKLENLRFSFDGETLDPSDTPETLDIEGNECIDVFTK